MRCLYQNGSLLEGWQERAWSLPIHPAAGKRAPVLPHPKAPGALSALQVPQHPWLPAAPSADRELEAFSWCCQRVRKPQFCTRFAEKRPRVGCEGYVPPAPSESPGLHFSVPGHSVGGTTIHEPHASTIFSSVLVGTTEPSTASGAVLLCAMTPTFTFLPPPQNDSVFCGLQLVPLGTPTS